ncbi:hypothetical protein M413DRAFT_410751 [Hebeloma cylindrosporum]|uniref:4-hydroxybenzoate polyprenyltransferase, mitochondrial n=1 Tax=Hebeloma cylindrosporum TaxID=76867 RepID=A0A0C3BXC3_HEBCY|nr:hypothetical protein M413DRAFT_410751 [Hebeloma cylindrosporum h7]
MQPYLELIRLEKPTGTILMFWPFAWGLTMAAFKINLPLTSYGFEIVKCFMGAFILRSSACTVNDIIDMNMDAGVERTQHRPLPSGRVSVFAATVYLIMQYAIGVVFFYLAFSNLAIQNRVFFVVAETHLSYSFAIYPLLKRVTYWPQAWLGIAMNFGFITAWMALTSSDTVSNIPLVVVAMAGCWCWTMLYDTIYACQDIRDDMKVGVRSTAILFGTWIRPLLVGCGITFLAMLAAAGYLKTQGPAYFLVSVGGTLVHLVWQYRTVDLANPRSCWENFNRNGQLGWIIWGGLMIDYCLRIVSLDQI